MDDRRLTNVVEKLPTFQYLRKMYVSTVNKYITFIINSRGMNHELERLNRSTENKPVSFNSKSNLTEGCKWGPCLSEGVNKGLKN